MKRMAESRRVKASYFEVLCTAVTYGNMTVVTQPPPLMKKMEVALPVTSDPRNCSDVYRKLTLCATEQLNYLRPLNPYCSNSTCTQFDYK